MKAALISMGSKSSEMVAQAMKKYFGVADSIELREIEITLGNKKPTILYKGEPLGHYDCIYAKGSFRYNQILRSISTIARKTAYMPIEPTAFSLGHDKLLTQLRLEEENIPMPPTYLAATSAAAKKILERINYPIMMKFPEGTQGQGVMFADSFASANSMLDALTALKQPFIIQEYVDTSGTDLRVIVVGNNVCAAVRRTAHRREERSNVHVGGKCTPTTVDNYVKRISVAAAKAIGAEICGVDILEGPKGPMVLEVNLSPGLQGIMEVSAVDIPDRIAKYLADQTRKRLDAHRATGTKRIMEDVGISKADSAAVNNHIVSAVDLRQNRLLLPPVVTGISAFSEGDEIVIEAAKGRIVIKRLDG